MFSLYNNLLRNNTALHRVVLHDESREEIIRPHDGIPGQGEAIPCLLVVGKHDVRLTVLKLGTRAVGAPADHSQDHAGGRVWVVGVRMVDRVNAETYLTGCGRHALTLDIGLQDWNEKGTN